jgi:Bacterial SCP ortholog
VPGSRRRTDAVAGRTALAAWRAEPDSATADLATAVRWTLEVLAEQAPGGSVEVRVPPYGVVQCVEGQSHKRGTPPNVVETDARTWLDLVTGVVSWPEALASGRVLASGNRADLSGYLPLDAGTVGG